VFIGYAEGSKAYRILDPGTQCVCTTRDVVFDEGRGWIWDKAVDDSSTPTSDNFTVKYVHFEGAEGVDSSPPPSMSTPVPSLHRPQRYAVQPRPRLQRCLHHHHHNRCPHALQQRRPPLRARLLQYQLTSSPARWSSLPRSLTTRSASTRAMMVSRCAHDLDGQLHLACDDGEPQSFAEAKKDTVWRAAIKAEMDAVEKNRT
jgi:hypothetical protein